ncbi:type IV pilin [Haladaptatus sp. GCM10025893]|uniref:type IV pilin n=1 Tax=Haladaptatus sp. GCM10025893 TaxID=3252659 RepID=UPI003611BACA
MRTAPSGSSNRATAGRSSPRPTAARFARPSRNFLSKAEARGRVSRRGTSPVLGVVLLTLLTVVGAGFVGATVLQSSPASPAPQAVIDVTVNPDTGQFTFVLRDGDSLSVAALSIQISINDEPLAQQPPVPFFAATGFESGPTGPFNVASDDEWSAGEEATVAFAATNRPAVAPGDTVTVRIISENRTVAVAEVVVLFSGARATVTMAISGL